MPSSRGLNFVEAGEGQYICGPNAAFWPKLRPVQVIFYCHGANATMNTILQNPYELDLIRRLSKHFLVFVSDWGGNTWGNQTGINRIASARNKLIASAPIINIDTTAPVGMIGASMGAAVALNYTRANPLKVGFVGCLIPLLDISMFRDGNFGGFQAAVDAAYGGTYDDFSMGPIYNPVRYAAELPEEMPIHLWVGEEDSLTPIEMSDTFLTVRPQTERDIYDVGPEDHSFLVYEEASDSIVNFCLEHGQF